MNDPTDADRVKAKAALGELGEVTTAVEAVAQGFADERAPFEDLVFALGLIRRDDVSGPGVRAIESAIAIAKKALP